MITGSASSSVKERVEGYKKALIDNGIKPDPGLVRKNGIPAENSGYLLTKKLFEKTTLAKDVTVIVGVNDQVAFGIIKYLKETGIKIPGQMSVVGFDDLPISEMIDPALTTVAQPLQEMGKTAVELIIDRIKGTAGKTYKKIRLTPKLVIRNSVKNFGDGSNSFQKN
jgi:DNA-binding LacI/PurR family transcriptional regulator